MGRACPVFPPTTPPPLQLRPAVSGRYADTNSHFQRFILNAEEDGLSNQLRGDKHDSHGLPYCNLDNDAHQLVIQTFSETVAAHGCISPVPHERNFSP